MRITIACPEALISDANHFAMVLGYGPADGATYGDVSRQDDGGNLYACASTPVGPNFVTAAQTTLQRPAWDTGSIIDMVAANRAQAALVYSETPVTALVAKLTACAGDNAIEVLTSMGLVDIIEAV